jgi:tetratricopeptide (TPR) repeat protein
VGQAHRELAGLLLIDAKHATDDAVRFDLLVEAGQLRLRVLDAPATAIGPLSEALELRPGDQDLTSLLADAYKRAGLFDEAVALLQNAIAAFGGRRSKELASLQLAMANVVTDRKSQLSWMLAAFESNPKSVAVDLALADLATEMGEYETALKALRALAALKDPAPLSRALIYVKQARIAQLQGDPHKALILTRKALTEDSALIEARELLSELGGRS